jgi:dolichyl-phosphate beta-glucosyltransferase
VVDDGSKDNTYSIAAAYKAFFPELRVIRIHENRGKGYAVKNGFLNARGEICVFLDADGSVPPWEIEKNLRYLLEENFDIFIGSRVLRAEGQILKVKLYRELMGKVFSFFTSTLLLKNIRDTQCGFKMFKRKTIEPLFSRMRIERFGFDMELLYTASKMGYKIKEGPVSWQHVKGSKINLFKDSIIMFFNIFQVKYENRF